MQLITCRAEYHAYLLKCCVAHGMPLDWADVRAKANRQGQWNNWCRRRAFQKFEALISKRKILWSDAHGNFQGDQCCFQFPSWAAKLKIVTSMLPRFVGHAARVHFLLGAPWKRSPQMGYAQKDELGAGRSGHWEWLLVNQSNWRGEGIPK